jgi:hypothetical protein
VTPRSGSAGSTVSTDASLPDQSSLVTSSLVGRRQNDGVTVHMAGATATAACEHPVLLTVARAGSLVVAVLLAGCPGADRPPLAEPPSSVVVDAIEALTGAGCDQSCRDLFARLREPVDRHWVDVFCWKGQDLQGVVDFDAGEFHQLEHNVHVRISERLCQRAGRGQALAREVHVEGAVQRMQKARDVARMRTRRTG